MDAGANGSRTAEPPPSGGSGGDGPGARPGWADYTVPAVVFLFCGAVAYVSAGFEEALPIIVGHSMQPRVFPIFLVAVMAVLNLALIARIAAGGGGARPARIPRVTWITVASMAAFYALAEYVDLMAALALVMFALGLAWGQRRWWAAGAVALATTALIFFSFDLVLEVRFPRGLLTDWYYG